MINAYNAARRVSVPYEITLLSNGGISEKHVKMVSVPYEITLLSNPWLAFQFVIAVSVPYEITLLSNLWDSFVYNGEFQYLMKLHYSQTCNSSYKGRNRFSTL